MIEQHIKVMESGPKEDIEIGHQGEYNVRQVVFDLSAIAEAVGSGTATIIHYPIEGAPYTVPAFAGESYDVAEQVGNTLTWTIGQLATQHKNNGLAVVTWTTAEGLKKSRRYKTKCQPSIEVSDVEQAAQQAYIDQMAKIAADIAGSVQAAASDVQAASTAAESAEESAQAAEASATTATTKAQEASQSATTATTKAGEAEQYANLAAQHAESAGYVFFDVDVQTGEAIATVTDAVDEAMTFSVDEANGDLEVTLI